MKSLFTILCFSTLCNLLQAQISDSTTVVQPVPIETDYNNKIFTIVEDSPEFPGGQDALMTYLMNNIKYPHEAMEASIQGTVYVTFVIETDGAVSNVKVLRGIGGACDEEAVRVVKGMPNWTPGKQRGKAVRVQFNLPIRFVLVDDTPAEKDEKTDR
ncbi:MAG: hypothetical protein A2W93_08285 [Bacteroidetes bacterium GWF2_43_63]|nr:MAG: hypothetical protein A2W94_04940 [Bacteroidetes bacterium GWE2_42_42]OFY55607.1 MAG: hypothetical protein A2W93_08285 [Bacteroidetes bacterium GWF2_43_63]HBG71626.1 hypothetical protein [Bacteroidales bacterium]HCB62159.1 hypothetical protein [Bacteroidales bacterium]HCY22387.1 hypothetical protein [Bacteroidales bacterium]